MKTYLRRRVARKIASAMLDGFSSRELREIADGLLRDQAFLGELANMLRDMDMVLKSMEHEPVPTSAMLTSAMLTTLSDRQWAWVRKAHELVQRRRISKRTLRDLMVSASPDIENHVIEDQTVREMLAAYARSASERGLVGLFDHLEGPHSDAYLEGIMKRREDRH